VRQQVGNPLAVPPVGFARGDILYIYGLASTIGNVLSSTFQTGFRRVGGGASSYLDADHRPPLKRGVRFSRATLSRRLSVLRCNRRNQLHQLHQPILAIQLAFRQLLPTAVAPTLIPMRPNPSLDPMVEFVEERSDVGTFVIVPPAPQNWI
jgi:hypothetical protein